MSTTSTKYHPRTLVPASEIGSGTVREVQMPARILKAVHESAAVVLGSREPDDGRYRSLVRSAFIKPSNQPVKPGESPCALSGPTEMNAERHTRAVEMNTKNFDFGFEGKEGPIVSELRGAQQTAVNLLRREQEAARHPVKSPTPYTVPAAAKAISTLDERRAHVERMRASNVFPGPTFAVAGGRPVDAINSTQRSSYMGVSVEVAGEQREGAASLRKIQTTTSWAAPANTSAKDWRSVKEHTMTGAPGAAAALSKQNLSTCVNIGSAAVNAKDTLKSLKQIDFVPHKATPTPAPAFASHESHFVLGSVPRDVDSTSRVSYTPTVFVASSSAAHPARGESTTPGVGAPLRSGTPNAVVTFKLPRSH